MAFELSVAVLDACVLYPLHLRNVLVQAAVDWLVDARWTKEIHGEWMRSLIADVPYIQHRKSGSGGPGAVEGLALQVELHVRRANLSGKRSHSCDESRSLK